MADGKQNIIRDKHGITLTRDDVDPFGWTRLENCTNVEIKDVFATIVDCTDVTITGSSLVNCYGRCRVSVKEYATVEAHENTLVEAKEWSNVRARQNSTVVLRDYAKAVVWDNAKVLAIDYSTVEAHHNTSVKASGNALVIIFDTAIVNAIEQAVIGVNNGSPVVHAHDNVRVIIHDKQNLRNHIQIYDEASIFNQIPYDVHLRLKGYYNV